MWFGRSGSSAKRSPPVRGTERRGWLLETSPETEFPHPRRSPQQHRSALSSSYQAPTTQMRYARSRGSGSGGRSRPRDGGAHGSVHFAMLVLVRPATRQLVLQRDSRRVVTQTTFAVVCVALPLPGVHASSGRSSSPRSSRTTPPWWARTRAKVEDLVLVLFSPSSRSLGCRHRLASSRALLRAVIIGVASLGKFGSSAVERAHGPRMAAGGLMELIVLHVACDISVLSPWSSKRSGTQFGSTLRASRHGRELVHRRRY